MAEDKVVNISKQTFFETGLDVPAVATAKFPHPDTLKSYNFDHHNNYSTSTVNGKTATVFDNSFATTKTMKMVDSEGNLIGFFDKKVRGNRASEKKVTKKTTISTRGNEKGALYGVSKVKKTNTNTAKMNVGTEFVKDANGVVKNLDSKEYKIAHDAKKKADSEKYESEKIRNTLNVIKTELPADINEIKSMLSLIMKHLGLNITAATEEEIGANDPNIRANLMDAVYGTGAGIVANDWSEKNKTGNWGDWYIKSPSSNPAEYSRTIVEEKKKDYKPSEDDPNTFVMVETVETKTKITKENSLRTAMDNSLNISGSLKGALDVVHSDTISSSISGLSNKIHTNITGMPKKVDVKKNLYIS